MRRWLLLKIKKNIRLKLFISTFCLSLFTFGGGYAIVSLMKQKFVDNLKWIGEDEMLDFTAIAQVSPGAVAINAFILVGYRTAGRSGAAIAILGTVLPPMIILSIVSLFYAAVRDNILVNAVLKGVQAGVAAVIADVAVNLGGNIIKEDDKISVIAMFLAFSATFFLKINVMFIILACGCIGAVKVALYHKKDNLS